MALADYPGYWAVLPADVRYDKELPANGKLLYAEISALCDQRGYCFATNRYFAELFGVSIPTIQRLVKALVDKHYVRVEVERSPATREVTERRIYAGINAADPHLKNDMTSPQKCGDPSPQKCGVEQSNKDLNNIPLYPPNGKGRAKIVPKWKPERFNKFWDFYSHQARGENRKAAVKAWDKLQPSDELIDAMGQALLRQLASEEWKRGIGIPYAATWLNNCRWEDILPPSEDRAAETTDDGIVRESGYLPVW